MKLAILDRDGVINVDSSAYIKTVEEWQPLPGSIEAIAKLTQAGFTTVVATNQSGLGRGLFGLDDLEAMHQKLRDKVENLGGQVAAIYYCPHTPDAQCSCRKPLPGMLEAIASDFGLSDLNGIPVIGDSLRDLQAGIVMGCQPVLVRTGKGSKAEAELAKDPRLANTLVFDDLADAVNFLTENR